MISKLAAWGRTRAEAIDRLRRALDEYAVDGIKTTLPFFREIVRDDEFIAGRLDTGFIPRFNQRRAGRGDCQASTLDRDMAIVAAALAYSEGAKAAAPNHQPPRSKWQTAARVAGVNQTRALKGA